MAKSGKQVKSVEVGKDVTEKLRHSRFYYEQPRTPQGKPFFVFVRPGDFLQGELVGKSGNRDTFRQQSYAMEVHKGKQGGLPLDVKPGQIEEFFGNAQLHSIISKCELMFAVVKIVYIGKWRGPKYLHAMKVYRVFRERGVLREDLRETSAKTPARRPFKEKGKGVPTYKKLKMA